MANEGGQPSGAPGSELPTAWKSKVRQMLLEGLSSDAMVEPGYRRKQSFHSASGDGSASVNAKSLFAELDQEKHQFEQQYHRYMDRAPRAKTGFGSGDEVDVDTRSVDSEDDAEQELVYEQGLKLLRRLSAETQNMGAVSIGAEEVALLCELFEKKAPSRVSSHLTSEYIELLPDQLYDSHIKDYLMREFSDHNNKFSRRFRQKSDGTSLSRTSSNFSVTSPLPSPVDLRKTFSLTKTLLNGKGSQNGEGSPGLRSYRSYTEVLNRKSKSKTNGSSVGRSRLYRTVSTRSNSGEKNGSSGSDDTNLEESKPQTTLEVDLALTERLYQMLLNIDEWSFNIHEVESVAPKGAMVSIGFGLFERHRLLETFNIREDTMLRFLSKLQDAYRQNPYHNWMHASDCAQTMSHLILRGGFSLYTSDLLRFALIFSALAHDVRHPGVTNSYLIKIGHPLAIRYNDKSPLENMHASTVFEIVRKPKYNILTGLNTEQYQDFRHAVIALVLATDNAEHNFLMSKIEKIASSLQSSETVPISEGDNLAIMSAALHAADISASAKPWEIYNEWTKRLTVEFRLQGDLERKRGMDVLPFMDRNSGEPIARLQAGFIMAISMPLYKQLDEISGIDLSPALSYINQNLDRWKEYATRKCTDDSTFGKRASDIVVKKLAVDRARRQFIKKRQLSLDRNAQASAENSAT